MTEKKLSQFGHNVWKGKLVKTVTASFNTIMGKMTEMSQRKKETQATSTGKNGVSLVGAVSWQPTILKINNASLFCNRLKYDQYLQKKL